MGICSSSKNTNASVNSKKIETIHSQTKKEKDNNSTNVVSPKKPFNPISQMSILEDIHKFYNMQREIGSGSFGIVREAKNIKNDKTFAIKTIWKNQVEDELYLREEIEILLSIDEENIIKCFEVYEDKNCIHYVMEYIQGGDLFDFIINSSSKKLDEKLALNIFMQMIKAVHYLHCEGFMHRDIKPENFLIFTDDKNQLKIKLIDFGFACHFKPNEKKRDKVGSINYIAPEMLLEEDCEYDCKIDIWALGICLYNMLVGKQPFADDDIVLLAEKIKKDELNFSHPVFSTINHNTKKIIEEVLNKNPHKRPSAADIKLIPWLNQLIGTDEQETKFEEFKPKQSNIQNIQNLISFKKNMKAHFWNFCVSNLKLDIIKIIFIDFDKIKEDLFSQDLKNYKEVIDIIIKYLKDKNQDFLQFLGKFSKFYY